MKYKLYHKAKTGSIVEWEIWSEDDEVVTEWGQEGGKKQQARYKAEPKNVGKKNEKTATEQAEFEAKAEYEKQLRSKKYFTNKEEALDGSMLPMGAKDYREDKAIYPAYIQPKLDGVRCLAYWEGDKVKLLSRGGQEWTVPTHINEAVSKFLPKNVVLDGELYVHGKSCQTVTSYVKKEREETKLVQLFVYDCILLDHLDWNFEKRYDYLEVLAHDFKGGILLVPTTTVVDYSDAKYKEEEFVDAGYEGAILRNKQLVYMYGKKTYDMLKIKTFEDHEFKIIDVREGKGKYEGCAVFICQNDTSDATFETDFNATMEERAELFKSKDDLIGKLLTVKHFGRTDDGLPRFPKGKVIRDPKDLPLNVCGTESERIQCAEPNYSCVPKEITNEE